MTSSQITEFLINKTKQTHFSFQEKIKNLDILVYNEGWGWRIQFLDFDFVLNNWSQEFVSKKLSKLI